MGVGQTIRVGGARAGGVSARGSEGKAAGVYLYRLELVDPRSGALGASLLGKTVLLR